MRRPSSVLSRLSALLVLCAMLAAVWIRDAIPGRQSIDSGPGRRLSPEASHRLRAMLRCPAGAYLTDAQHKLASNALVHWFAARHGVAAAESLVPASAADPLVPVVRRPLVHEDLSWPKPARCRLHQQLRGCSQPFRCEDSEYVASSSSGVLVSLTSKAASRAVTRYLRCKLKDFEAWCGSKLIDAPSCVDLQLRAGPSLLLNKTSYTTFGLVKHPIERFLSGLQTIVSQVEKSSGTSMLASCEGDSPRDGACCSPRSRVACPSWIKLLRAFLRDPEGGANPSNVQTLATGLINSTECRDFFLNWHSG